MKQIFFRWAERPPTDADRDAMGMVLLCDLSDHAKPALLFQHESGIAPRDPALWCRTHDLIMSAHAHLYQRPDPVDQAMLPLTPALATAVGARELASIAREHLKTRATIDAVGKRMASMAELLPLMLANVDRIAEGEWAEPRRELRLIHARMAELILDTEKFIAELPRPVKGAGELTEPAAVLQT